MSAVATTLRGPGERNASLTDRAGGAAPPSERPLRIFVGEGVGEVSSILVRPAESLQLLLLAHGAGAGMRHPFTEALALRLAERGTSTLRYHFPYM